ncbi:MurT ligase domain-containing protein, partial [Patescibacteria group bacterium]|nr:MurT ligase domain-containing protein [Patescibacteria group bacterium]
KDLTKNTELIINADDPHLAFIGKQVNATVSYFGLDDKTYYLSKMQHATDTIFCPSCKERLTFSGVYFSHLGDWKCTKCGFTHPKPTLTAFHVTSPVEGIYNMYNTLAATLVSETLGIDKKQIEKSLTCFTPAFGRMEQVIYQGKSVRILLSKNPTGFNESLRTVLSSKQKGPMLLLLNDRIPDGTDVSWIWDVDFELLDNYHYPLIISGDRALDMGVRLKYAVEISNLKSQISKIKIKNQKYKIQKNLREATNEFISEIKDGETGWILATYSAMIDVRKILTGKKIL